MERPARAAASAAARFVAALETTICQTGRMMTTTTISTRSSLGDWNATCDAYRRAGVRGRGRSFAGLSYSWVW